VLCTLAKNLFNETTSQQETVDQLKNGRNSWQENVKFREQFFLHLIRNGHQSNDFLLKYNFNPLHTITRI